MSSKNYIEEIIKRLENIDDIKFLKVVLALVKTYKNKNEQKNRGEL